MMTKVLFAEDDAALRDLVAEQLQQAGYAVRTAADGTEAVRALGEEAFDLALLDIRMPGRDGLDVLREVRARHPRTRTVMLTGVDEFSVALEAVKRGADDYITKPFALSDLLSCISKALER